MKRVVVVDNYDSFTYNLVQYVMSLGAECDVRLNDKTTSAEIGAAKPDGILLSPGPGTPDDAGVTLDVEEFWDCNGAIFADPPEIVPSQVNQHHMFRAFFWVCQQFFSKGGVFFGVGTARASPGNRPE